MAALLTDHVPKKSICWAAVESNPVPTTGAVAGIMSDAAPPTEAATPPMAAELVHIPVCMKLAVVVPPIARQVKSQFSSQVSFVCAAMFSAKAGLVATMTEPKRISSINVPGDVTSVDTLPAAWNRSFDPICKKLAGSVYFAWLGSSEVAAVELARAAPSVCAVMSVQV